VKRKIANCLLGFTAGLVTAPLAIFAWPFVMAWFMYNETED